MPHDNFPKKPSCHLSLVPGFPLNKLGQQPLSMQTAQREQRHPQSAAPTIELSGVHGKLILLIRLLFR